MTDAPTDELDDLSDVHPDVVAALVDNNRRRRQLARTWLSYENIVGQMVKLGFLNPDEQHLIIDAWNGCGRAARVARREQPETKLAKINFSVDSPHPKHGQPPTISAADFDMVLNDDDELQRARTHHEHDLRPEAVAMARQFISRLKASQHTPPL
jgi:hypothetical protein